MSPHDEPHSDAPAYVCEEAQAFHLGIRLFNEREWFEAHEAWEDAWHLADGDRKRFYQGLIQLAVMLEHARRGNPRGVRALSRSAFAKFEGLPARYHGVDLGDVLPRMRRLVQPVLDLPAERFAPGRSRGQSLPIDFAAAPRIELIDDPFADDRADG